MKRKKYSVAECDVSMFAGFASIFFLIMLHACKSSIFIFCSSGTENLDELLLAVMQRIASSNDHSRPQLLVSCWVYLFILYFTFCGFVNFSCLYSFIH